MSEDDEIYQLAFNESRSLLNNIENKNITNNQLINELETYLITSKELIDDDGNKLISYPSNFESISSAMTRDDINNDNNNNWSKHLLDKQFNINFDNGRYKNMQLDKDNQLDIGLAEIHLLDNQLSVISKKDKELNKKSKQLNNNNDYSPRSESIFITRSKRKDSNITSLRSSARSTPRSTPRDDSSIPLEDCNIDSTIDNNIDYSINYEQEIRRTDSNTYNNRKKSNKSVNIKPIVNKLTDEEELRLQVILNDNYDDYLSNQSDYFINKINTIDEKLKQFGHYDKMDINSLHDELFKENAIYEQSNHKSVRFNDANSTDPTKAIGKKYLLDQRLDRALKEHSEKIDNLLDIIQTKRADFNGLVVDEVTDTTTISDLKSASNKSIKTNVSTDSKKHKLLDMPNYKDVKPNRSITRQDISQLISELRDDVLQSQSKDSDTVDSTKDNKSDNTFQSTNKDTLNRLLQSIKDDVKLLSDTKRSYSVYDSHYNCSSNIRNEINEIDNNIKRILSNQCDNENEYDNENFDNNIDNNNTDIIVDDQAESNIDSYKGNNSIDKDNQLLSTDRFVQRELDLIKKLLDKSEKLKLPLITNINNNNQSSIMSDRKISMTESILKESRRNSSV